MVCGHCPVTLSISSYRKIKVAHIAAHLNAGIIPGVTVYSDRYIISPLLPVPNKPYGFCGR